MTNKQIQVYDLEQFPNCHTATFECRDSEDVKQFVISESRNDTEIYYDFLVNELIGLIGFNCVNYDYPLLHFLMAVVQMNKEIAPDILNMLLYEESQRIIDADYSSINPRDVKIPQLDLFKIHHFDNKAKMTSLTLA